MISGYATAEGTANFAKNNSFANLKNYTIFDNLTLSNVGIGTYLGDTDSKTDKLVLNALKNSVKSGINIIDTAINYRAQKAERSVGKAVTELVEDGINRNGLFICTKNGYVTNDGDLKEDFWQYIKSHYTEKGIVKAGDITSGYHCMTVPYLEDQLDRSLKNLNLDCIDLIYLHNAVEGQLQDISKEQFLKNLRSVFELYENKRKEGLIQYYGMATWECFRVAPDHFLYVSLSEILQMAKDVGGSNNGFRFIQLPYNMYLDQALMIKNQNTGENSTSILEYAKSQNIGVFSSVPLMQGRLLAPDVMPEFGNLIPSVRALQFIRSTPGILAPLVGQKSESHVIENLEVMKIPPLSENEFNDLIKKLTQS